MWTKIAFESFDSLESKYAEGVLPKKKKTKKKKYNKELRRV